MKITKKEKNNSVPFDSLEVGAVFTPYDCDDEGIIFLRVEDVYCDDEQYNAVSLECGEFVFVTPLHPVIRVSAELIVEY